MASNRHLGRIIALQTLYEYEFRVQSDDKSVDIDEILERNIARYKETVDDKKFVRGLVSGTSLRITELDEIIQPIAPEWPIEQIARVDRTILRLAVYELLNVEDVPPKVVINEAVELAKAFGADNSSKFVNGVLGTVYREHVEQKSAKKVKTNQAKSNEKTKTKTKSKPSSTKATKKGKSPKAK